MSTATPSQDIIDGLVKALEGMLLYVDEPADTDSPLQMAKEIDRIEFARAALSAYRASIQNDGWNEWKGGECPVADGVKFDVKTRDGRIWRSQDSALWDHFGEPYDIIAWRLAK